MIRDQPAEQGPMLDHRPVPALRNRVELRIGQVLVQVPRDLRIDHPVIAPVHEQRFVGDGLKHVDRQALRIEPALTRGGKQLVEVIEGALA